MNLQFLYQNEHKLNNFELFIGNLPPDTQPHFIKKIFNKWARLQDVIIKKSRYEPISSALIKFRSFSDMVHVYKKSYMSQIQGYPIKVEVSRNSLLQCNYCQKVGHWKQNCPKKNSKSRQVLNYGMYKKQRDNKYKQRQKDRYEKKLTKLDEYYQLANKSKNKNIGKQNQRNEQSVEKEKCKLGLNKNNTLQTNIPLPKISKISGKHENQNHEQFLSYVADFSLFDQEQKLDSTTYEDETQSVKSQKEPIFVKINPSNPKNLELISSQQERQLQALWSSGFFSNFNDKDGGIVRISRVLKDNFVY